MDNSTAGRASGRPSPSERRRRDSARGRHAYQALLARFEREVDPDGTLPADERARRAEQARAAHFRALGQRGGAASAQSRKPTRPPADQLPPPPADQPSVPPAERRRAARMLRSADWAHLWEQPEMRAALSDRDVGAVYRALQELGVTQRQIAQLTSQSQPEVSAILSGRQVRDVAVLERICDGLGIPRPLMRLLDKPPSQDTAYSEDQDTATHTLERVTAEMLRRHLIALGGISLVGTQVDKLGELLDNLAGVGGLDGLDPASLPSQLSRIHVERVQDLTRRLGAGDIHNPDPEVASAAAVLATRLLEVPGPEAVKQALQVAIAELHLEAGWSAFDAGRYRRALYHYARALELATVAGDAALQAAALRYAGLASVEHGYPDDGLKMLQCAQVKAWDIPSDEQRAVLIGVSGRAAAQACALEESANALVHLGDLQAAVTHLAKGRELWTPGRSDPFGDMDRPAARLELARGRLDVAEALAAASLRRWPEGKQLSRTLTGIVQATIHVQAGERDGLHLAHHTITAVSRLSSMRARRQLAPLTEALAAHPGPDAQQLARMARQLAA